MAVTQVLSLSLVSQDVHSNTSAVRLLYKSTQTGTSHNLTDPAWRCTVKVNGAVTETLTGKSDLHQNTTDILIDRVITVTHDSRGKATVTAESRMDTEISAGVVELTKTMALPDITGASALSAADGVIGSRATVVITAYDRGYTHSLSYRFGELSGWIGPDGTECAEAVRFSQRTVNLLLPESFYLQIPNSPSGTCTLTCTTYDGDQAIGSRSCTCTVTADPARCAPVITGTVEDIRPETLALTGNPQILVRDQSTARCTAQVTLAPGASVAQVRLGTAVLEDALEIPNITTGTFDFQVTDSRGYTGSCRVELPVIPYVALTLVAGVGRVDPDSHKALMGADGNCFTGSFGAAENTLTLTCRVDGGAWLTCQPEFGNGAYWCQQHLENLDYTAAHVVEFSVSDALQSVTRTVTVERSIPVFDWGSSDFTFRVPVKMPSLTIGGKKLGDNVVEWGMREDCYWRKWESGFAECWLRDYIMVEQIDVPWGRLYRADGSSMSSPYPVEFVRIPAETVTVNGCPQAHLVLTLRSNTETETGSYTVLCDQPVSVGNTLYLQYYAAGIWKEPAEGVDL